MIKQKTNHKEKVLVAMSGGIDSSVAAMMLHNQGYEVIGLTMKTWDYASSGSGKKETGCCSLDSIHDARNIAVQHGFPHYILDIRSEFGDFVINNFVDEYLAGRTPNPCVLCNTHIKWEALLKRADMLGCRYIATGHYAQVRQENGRYIISRGLDLHKDQSYVLWGLTQQSLARTLFPLGKFHKSEIRTMAAEMGFEELAKKSESYEICFIPNNDYREFIKHRKQGISEKLEGGFFVDSKGNILGKHHGYPFYTIGQRKGLEIAIGKPMFVIRIESETNTVVLGEADELKRQAMTIRNVNLIKYESVNEPLEALVKIRYKDKGTMALIHQVEDKMHVDFLSMVSGVAPGQSAVFYEGDDVIGGGFIEQQTQIKELPLKEINA